MDNARMTSPRPDPFQFSLKAMFIATTVVCVLLVPAHWFGGTYVFLATLSITLVAGCSLLYRSGHRGISLTLSIAAIVLSFLLFIPLLLLHSVVNYFGCWICGALRVRPKTYTLALTILGVLAYAVLLIPDAATLAEVIALRNKYSFLSLVDRLSFERPEKTKPVAATSDQQFHPAVLDNLDEMEERERTDSQGRLRTLHFLHERSLAQFLSATGFGVGRMAPFRPELLELEPKQKVRLPLPIAGISETKPSQLEAVHYGATRDFLNPDRIGYVRNREAVAGFESHGFSNLEEMLEGGLSSGWQLSRLELVSLLRHAEPRVYIAEALPQMDELEEIPHRALNEFEQQSLPKLRYDEDLVVDVSPHLITMLGAIRAGNDCLQCHEGTRGKLLGAFSYELTTIYEE